MEINYVSIEEVTYGEPVEQQLLDELLELELIQARRDDREVLLVAEKDCEDLRTMLRLATVLEINPAGVETIMYMRRRMRELQQELRRLRLLERAYAAMRPNEPIG